MTQFDHDVIIVGGGPVGTGLAIDLGQRGLDVLIVERNAALHSIPKGQNLTQRTMEHFQAWGCESELRAARIVPADYAIGGMTCYGTLLSNFHYDWLQRETVRPYYYTDNERLPQYATEAVLRARAEELRGVTGLYGWSGSSLCQDDDGVELELERTTGGNDRRRYRSRYLVGCDGSGSTVRDAAGISQSLADHDRLMILLVFRSTELHDLLKRYPGKQFYCVLHPELEGYWRFFGRVDLGSTWFFHAPVPAGTTADNFDFEDLLWRAAGSKFDLAIEHIGFWDLRFALADSYRSGRVFIAGDAAHSHPPYGGYGINTGFEDARNLGWKLAADRQAWAGEALLDSYDAERRPVFASTARDFIDRFIREDRDFLQKYDPTADVEAFAEAWASRNKGDRSVSDFEPNYEGSPVVFETPGSVPSAVGKHEFTARPGHHLAPALLSDGRQSNEAFGPGFTLFAFDREMRFCDQMTAEALKLNIPLTVVSDPGSPAADIYRCSQILVRPDNFVAWTDQSGEVNPTAILRKASGHI